MAAPTYTNAKSPVKNLQGIARYLGIDPEDTDLPLFTQLLLYVLALLGILPPAGVTVVTAGAGTYSAAQLLEGLIKRDCTGAGRTDTTDTAANILAAAGSKLGEVYQQLFVTIVNTSDAAETITLAGGTGVTLKGTITCEQNCAIRIAILRTGTATLCIRQV